MKKICIVATSLGKGGAERSSAILSQMLTGLSYDVHIMITKNDIDYKYAGTLFNLEKELGVKFTSFDKFKTLRQYFKRNKFDVIIDNRTRPSFFKEFFLYNFVFKAKKRIAVVRSYGLQKYFPQNKVLAKLLYKKPIELVAVSKEIEKSIKKNYGLKNVKQIYNAIDVNLLDVRLNKEVKTPSNFILWYGRIEESVKNFTLLLNAYKKSTLPDKNINLLIIGFGNDVHILKGLINNLKVNNKVKYAPFLRNPFPYVKNAVFTALTSYHEGFPRVLIESLTCGTPVISVDCKSGPSEIVKHKHNGLLVENHNPEALAKAFNSFVIDKQLYKTCKNNSRKSVEKFAVEKIAKDWKRLIEQDIN
ncbi:hypothetical protein PK35_11665 [Tamlana nanhaiensis]|uniref:Glycosyl transferase family 1 domain-containing protein n=1 Tax=Neotamlana nanhaiensis TaxID=1382798 RepID=A0A0D7W063_9FLAO|nr:glycosyltransferase [Tamlana nanhaiensis]KJD32088.1 hypothetical protein PK35_10780 [Tamlana nanhaiensis]KJD32250.1 hypothetical protein PK35_11665 [Tamlana nanhaiensis]